MPLHKSFVNLHWRFTCCKYLAITHINTKNGYEKQSVTKIELRLIGKSHNSATGIPQTCG